MSERDYQKDLEICEKATEGPWEHNTGQIYSPLDDKHGRLVGVMYTNLFNADFTCTAREALPYYIKRCMEMEAEAAVMCEALTSLIGGIECGQLISLGGDRVYSTQISKEGLEVVKQALSSTAGQDYTRAQDKKIATLKAELGCGWLSRYKEYKSVLVENVRLQEEIKRLRECLEFYANPKSYKTGCLENDGSISYVAVPADKGKYARSVLAGDTSCTDAQE